MPSLVPFLIASNHVIDVGLLVNFLFLEESSNQNGLKLVHLSSTTPTQKEFTIGLICERVSLTITSCADFRFIV